MGFIDDAKKIIRLFKVLRTAYRDYKWQIIGLSALGMLGGILEGMGITTLIPLLSVAAGSGGGESNIILDYLRRAFSFVGIDFSLKYLLIFICLLFIAKAPVLVASVYVSEKIKSGYQEKTRSALFRQVLQGEWRFLLTQKVGYLETVLMTDARRSALLLDHISMTILTLANLFVYLLVALNISFPITAITLIFGGILIVSVKPLVYRTKLLAHKTKMLNKKIAHFINESVIGMKTIKAMAVSEKIFDIGKEQFVKLKKLEISTNLLRSLFTAFTQPVSVIFISLIFALFYKSPAFSFAALVAIIYLVQRIFTYVQTLQNKLQGINESFPYLTDILEYGDEAEKYKENNPGKDKFVFNEKLEFQNVDFAYNSEAPVLSGINLRIGKGEMVGLIGPSGAGKTTVVDLILRLFECEKGGIFVDGKNIKEIDLNDWRKNVGYISQDLFLKNDTLENNIKFYDDSVSDGEMIAAAKKVGIYDFIEASPEKFKTTVGERGIMLSGGQRQRIVLARILARNPKFLILDEATSSLDTESELKIKDIIEEFRGNVAVLVVAHRLKTVESCDRLVVLENGKIVEEGTPDDLLKNNDSYFYKVYNIRS